MAKIKDLVAKRPGDQMALQSFIALAAKGDPESIQVMAGLELDEDDPTLIDYPPFIAKFAEKGPEKPWSSLARWVNAVDRRKLEAAYPATEAQKRLLAFGCVQLVNNHEPCRTLHIISDENDVNKMLVNYWGIDSAEEALATAERLASAEVHTAYADEIFIKLIKKGVEEVTADDVRGFVKFFAMRNLCVKELRNCASDLGISIRHENFTPSESYIGCIAEMAANGQFSSEHNLPFSLGENVPDEEKEKLLSVLSSGRGHFTEHIYNQIAQSVNETLTVYRRAYNYMLKCGLTEDELNSVNTVIAWDCGRTGIIARYGYKMGYLTESEAWQVLQTASDTALPHYKNWREYFIGYIFGRAIAYGNSSGDLDNAIGYLLNDPRSPYNETEYKPEGYKRPRPNLFETIELPTLIKNLKVPSMVADMPNGQKRTLFKRNGKTFEMHGYVYNILNKHKLFDGIVQFLATETETTEILLFDDEGPKQTLRFKKQD